MINKLFNYEYRNLKKYKDLEKEFTVRKAKGFKNKKVVCRNGKPVLFINDSSKVAYNAGLLLQNIETGYSNLKLLESEY